jgi:hypothetical protein
MAYTNYADSLLRASAATSGTSGQDTAVTLPETITEFWVIVNKTAEANADNLLTVWLQSQVNSVWFDLSWDSITTTTALTTAADVACNVTRTPNIVDASSDPTFTIMAHYASVPSNVVRTVWIASGTTPAHTFSVNYSFAFNKF